MQLVITSIDDFAGEDAKTWNSEISATATPLEIWQHITQNPEATLDGVEATDGRLHEDTNCPSQAGYRLTVTWTTAADTILDQIHAILAKDKSDAGRIDEIATLVMHTIAKRRD